MQGLFPRRLSKKEKVVVQEWKNVKHFQYRGYARDILALHKDRV